MSMTKVRPATEPHIPGEGDVAAALETALALHGASMVTLPRQQAMLVPDGMTLQSIKSLHDEWLPFPERRKGTAAFAELASFIEHTNRFKDGHSAIFVKRDEKEPRFLTVLDYHPGTDSVVSDEAPPARWCLHRSAHQPKISEVWGAWQAVDGKTMAQAVFAAFLEDRILDIAPPPPAGDTGHNALVAALGGRIGNQAELLSVSRGLRVRETAEVTNAQVLETGEIEAVYKTALSDQSTGQPLRIPTCFCVQAPVFEGGAPYLLWMRVAIRREEGRLLWTMKRWRPDLIVQHALQEMIDKVKAETGLPVLIGSPEQ